MSVLDRIALLEKLEPIEPDEAVGDDRDDVRAMSIARALRSVAELDAEHAYKLCRNVAERALGEVPEPTLPIQD
jgi:hypothetical protein